MAWQDISGPIPLPNAQDGDVVAVRGVRAGVPGPENTVRISGGFTPGLRVTTASLTDATEDQAYGPVSLSAAGGSGGYQWDGVSIPTGMSLSAGGSLSGTPTVPGATTVVARVTDSNGASVVGHIALTIQASGGALVINESDLGTFPAAATPLVAITTSGGVGTDRQITYEGDWLPDDLDVDSSYGEFRGTVQ